MIRKNPTSIDFHEGAISMVSMIYKLVSSAFLSCLLMQEGAEKNDGCRL